MKTKTMYRSYDATASLETNMTCTECEATNVDVVQLCAEHNAGEKYTVEVCKGCVKELLSWFPDS